MTTSIHTGSLEKAEVVIVEWDDLTKKDTSSEIVKALDQAFGPDAIGIIAVRGVPGFAAAKNALLGLAHKLATLPNEYLEKELSDSESLYNAGWSHGKEKLGDAPDTAKGSFYFNPVVDLAGTPELRAEYPLSYPKNIWPDRIPEFKARARDVGCIMKDAVVVLARHMDAVVQSKCCDYPPSLLYRAIKDTDKVKGRLLYYFPLSETPVKDDSWISWHNDSGFLTALAGDLYVDHETGQQADCPDPKAGLYVSTRRGDLRVEIPPDCLAVQMGECTQIVTGGTFAATPHCVRGISTRRSIARVSLPCFIDTPPDFGLQAPPSCSRDQVLQASVPNKRVPALGKRWTHNGMTFGDFLHRTFSQFYDDDDA